MKKTQESHKYTLVLHQLLPTVIARLKQDSVYLILLFHKKKIWCKENVVCHFPIWEQSAMQPQYNASSFWWRCLDVVITSHLLLLLQLLFEPIDVDAVSVIVYSSEFKFPQANSTIITKYSVHQLAAGSFLEEMYVCMYWHKWLYFNCSLCMFL